VHRVKATHAQDKVCAMGGRKIVPVDDLELFGLFEI
jgi:hypothetical protein